MAAISRMSSFYEAISVSALSQFRIYKRLKNVFAIDESRVYFFALLSDELLAKFLRNIQDLINNIFQVKPYGRTKKMTQDSPVNSVYLM